MHSFIFKHEKQVILTNILYVRNMLGMLPYQQTCLSVCLLIFVIVAVYQPQIYSTHVCLRVCFCVSVCVHDNSKNNGSIHLKIEHIAVYENSSDEFNIGHCPSKVKVTA